MTTWLITGCSTGLGKSLAQAVLQRGDNAVVTARDPASVQDLVSAYPNTALAVGLDVRDSAQVTSAVKLGEARFGAIDVLVNNAGYGYRGAIEEAEDADIQALFATNFFGAVAMVKAVLPKMRARRSGTIVNISSIAGRAAAAGSGYYAASKFALAGMSDALRLELAPLGIRVMVVEPGGFRTDFAGRSLTGAKIAISDYEPTVGPRRKENDRSHGTQQGDPERAAEALIKVIGGTELPSRLPLGSDAVRFISGVVENQRKEVEAWKAVSESTDFA
jgi:NAD(P)-dependent dehydrogenase (short-subunit alcohol dehydrogenase family)